MGLSSGGPSRSVLRLDGANIDSRGGPPDLITGHTRGDTLEQVVSVGKTPIDALTIV